MSGQEQDKDTVAAGGADARLGDPEVGSFEEDLERTLRPSSLQAFVGQPVLREQLEIFIQAAASREEPLDHVLLAGPPGLGKTTLANIIASEMNVNIVTTSSPALERKADMAAIKELQAKHGASGFQVIGVNLDSRREDMTAYLAESRIRWPQIFEAGGLDSRPANELGILTLPTMILVDQQGKVVNRNIHVAELDRELKRLIR